MCSSLVQPDPFVTGHLSIKDDNHPLQKGLISIKFMKVINYDLLENSACKDQVEAKLITFVNFTEVQNQQPPKLSECEEQNADGQFTRPFWSGHLSSLINKCPVMKGFGYMRLYLQWTDNF